MVVVIVGASYVLASLGSALDAATRGLSVALVEAYAKEQGLWHDPQAEPLVRRGKKLELLPALAVA